MITLLTKERLIIFIRHLKGIIAELEKMVKELDDADTK
jgi:hypothetical protein